MKQINKKGILQFDFEYYSFSIISVVMWFAVIFLFDDYILGSIWFFGIFLSLTSMSILYEVLGGRKR